MTAAVAPPPLADPDQLPPTAAADRIVAVFAGLDRLAAERDLEPGGRADALFTELVELCGHRSGPAAAAVLADPRVRAATPRLRRLGADGEYRLERWWARRVVAAADAERELAAFPYLANYRALTVLELHTLAGLRSGAARVCVLGSGPLPLTALLTARALRVPVDAVDLDPAATALARSVLRGLSGGDFVDARTDDAARFAGVAEADVVILAALVGLDRPAKQAVIAAVAGRMRPGALLAVRSAYRLRTLLYPPCGVDEVVAAGRGSLRPLAEVHPLNDVVNSIVVAARG